jgi:hypothetical protein
VVVLAVQEAVRVQVQAALRAQVLVAVQVPRGLAREGMAQEAPPAPRDRRLVAAVILP